MQIYVLETLMETDEFHIWQPNCSPLTAVCLFVCPLGIRRDLWTACTRWCRAPATAHHSLSQAAPPAAPAAAPAARQSCWMMAQSGEALEDLYPWCVSSKSHTLKHVVETVSGAGL